MTGPNDVFKSGQSVGWPGSTSLTLIDQLWKNDEIAWEQMVKLYAPAVYRWCRHFGLSAEDAADVGQEVFITVSEKITDFRYDDPGATFRGWLWTLSRNKAIDHLRKNTKRPYAVGGDGAYERLEQIPDAYEEFCQQAPHEEEEISYLLQTILNRVRVHFKSTTWQAFWRTCVDGADPTDVAEELGISVNAIYLGRSRILRQLREELGDVSG